MARPQSWRARYFKMRTCPVSTSTSTAHACAPNAKVTVSGAKYPQACSPGRDSRSSVLLRTAARDRSPSATPRSGSPATWARPPVSTTSAGAHSSISEATTRALPATSRAVRATAGAIAVGQSRGVGRHHEHAVGIDAELRGRDLGHGGLVRLALGGDADVDVHRAGRADAHVGALER